MRESSRIIKSNLKQLKQADFLAFDTAATARAWQKISPRLGTTEKISSKNFAYAQSMRIFGAVCANLIRNFFPPVLLRFGRVGLVGALALAVAAYGWGVSVSASQGSLPGDILYGVKLAHEKRELIFAGSERKKVEVLLAHAAKRAEEINKISQENFKVEEKRQKTKVAADSLKKNLSIASEQIDKAKIESNQAAGEVASVIEQRVGEIRASLTVSDDVRTELKSVAPVINETELKASLTTAAAILSGDIGVNNYQESTDQTEAIKQVVDGEPVVEVSTSLLTAPINAAEKKLEKTLEQISKDLEVAIGTVSSSSASASDEGALTISKTNSSTEDNTQTPIPPPSSTEVSTTVVPTTLQTPAVALLPVDTSNTPSIDLTIPSQNIKSVGDLPKTAEEIKKDLATEERQKKNDNIISQITSANQVISEAKILLEANNLPAALIKIEQAVEIKKSLPSDLFNDIEVNRFIQSKNVAPIPPVVVSSTENNISSPTPKNSTESPKETKSPLPPST